ncbi:hypothetical protein JAAARDRAFT_139991, partial [Jaapia argillacea MUCL 33604]
QDITCVVNVQHDCISSRCTTTAQQAIMIKRTKSIKTRTVVAHMDSPHYVVNMLSLHNHTLIRKALPSSLLTLPAFFLNRV